MDIRSEVAKRLKNHPLRSQEGRSDPIIHCKLFHAFGGGTWYLTEYDGQDIAFGFVTGLVADEWGYVSISELESLKLGGEIPRIECDLFFEPIAFSKLKTQEGY
ncbi:DUF2958 domain-containing protein [Parerythrobacter aestuarii]|uniref:DUF2958 domain-containing protein n=1 Tax=Parerythrobacter aestuarii TaxID=3020909 RepID=UPI0024DE4FB5|nr:DUF2958 domain-containing protein [Parerythrobacter aestuarii]